MATEKLTLVADVQGATRVAQEIGKIEGAVDRVSAKAGVLRGRISGAIGSVGGFLGRTGLGYTALNVAGSLGADVLGASNAGAGGVAGAAGTAGNVLGGAASGAAIAGPIGALAGAAVGIGKSAVEIGQSTAKQADEVAAQGDAMLALKPSLDDLNTSIAGIDKGLADIQSNGLNFFLGGGDAVKSLTELKAKYEEQKRVLVQEGSDTERALRANAYAIVQAINGLDLNVQVNVPVSVRTEGVSSVSYAAGVTSTNSYRGDPGYGR